MNVLDTKVYSLGNCHGERTDKRKAYAWTVAV